MTEQAPGDRKAEDALVWLAGIAREGTREQLLAADPQEIGDRLRGMPFFDLLATLTAEPKTDRFLRAEIYRLWIVEQPVSEMRHAAWFNLGVELFAGGDIHNRSEERRVGKECQ